MMRTRPTCAIQISQWKLCIIELMMLLLNLHMKIKSYDKLTHQEKSYWAIDYDKL